MNNKITVYDFVVKFNEFYNNVLVLIEEAYDMEYLVPRKVTNCVYDDYSKVKNLLEHQLEVGDIDLIEISTEINKINSNLYKSLKAYENTIGIRIYNKYCCNVVSIKYTIRFINSLIDCHREFSEDLLDN